MATLRERIAAAEKRAKEATERAEELKKLEAAGPKRQASRDVTQIREILVVELNLRRKYGCGFSGLAEIARKAKKDGIEIVAATGQAPGPEHDAARGIAQAPPPLPQQVTPAVGGVTASAPPEGFDPETASETERARVLYGLRPWQDDQQPPPAIMAEPEFDENDEPPVPSPPEAVAQQERDDLPWDD